MPVRKYRSVEEMPEPWHEPGSPELVRAIRATWDLAHRLARPSFPPGLYKHRSLADAQKLADEWERANVARQQKRLQRPG